MMHTFIAQPLHANVACTPKNEEIMTRKEKKRRGGGECHCNQNGYCVDDDDDR